jgi:hypothetical protein
MTLSRLPIAIAAAGALALVAGTLLAPPTETLAAWTSPQRGSSTLTAGTVQPPGALSCSGGGSNLLGPPPATTFTWVTPANPAGSAPRVDYYWTLTRTGVTISGSTTTNSAVISGGAATTGTYTFTVIARATGTWTSVAGPTGTFVKNDGLLGIIAATAACSVP